MHTNILIILFKPLNYAMQIAPIDADRAKILKGPVVASTQQ